MKNFFCGIIFIFFAQTLSATHIVGGEMNYHYLGNDEYFISLIIYRDCFNGQAPYDDSAYVGIFDSQGNVLNNIAVPVNDSSDVPNAINTPCLVPPTDICYKIAHYFTTLTLPPRPGGYIIAYQRCCRNNSVVNIVDVASTGATYWAAIPDQQYSVDDNPVFSHLPPTFICEGAPFTFDHSATDADGDSLVYSLYTPFAGGDPTPPANRPLVPSPPPFDPVIFSAPYSLSNVFGGVPLQINSQTGIITATPNSQGQFVYGILVQEYRNGVLIGETHRDFQVNVTYCANYTVASIFSPTLVCGSLDASFQNTSYGASTYSWFFGDPTTTNDTSTLMNPVYTYPDTGRYPLVLVAYAADPACNDTAFGEARVYPAFFSKFGLTHQPCTDQFQFIDSSYSLHSSSNYWLWNFGDNNFSSNQNPSHQYLNAGNFTVTLIASSDSGCTDTATVNVDVDPVPVSSFNLILDTCAHTATFNNTSQGASSYQWSFGDNNFSTDLSPQHNYMIDGNVTASLITTNDSGCTDTTQVTFNLPQVPIANFTWDVLPCDSLVHFHNLSINTPSFVWSFGDASNAYNTDPVHLYVHSGSYTVLMQALGTNLQCNDEITKTIWVNRKPLADFRIELDTCALLVSGTNYSTDATKYHWIFSDGFVDQSVNGHHNFSADGIVSVQLIAENDSGCSDTTSLTANIPPLPQSNFVWTHTDCDSLVSFSQQSANSVSYHWMFGDGDTTNDAQTDHIYHIAGDIPVELVSTSQYGCNDTLDKNIHIIIRTPADFDVFVDSCSREVYFSNKSPLAVYYDWNFGDQTSSTQKNPAHEYKENGKDYMITFTVNKESNCQEDIQKPIRYDVNDGENVYIPNSFTPNGDGLNDVFQLSLFKPCDNYSITIFDRWGQSVYENKDAFSTSWDGTLNGHQVSEGVYVYLLTGSHLKKTGYVVLIRQ